ncbi:LuxR family transcriptional regulator [Streptomyces sp. H27-C3]|uniref:AAA family ATPase n=1 Tax=Streptomyces sp. H27-C3 TaxID=3046305 RepID=UPI0024BAF44F|nr:LuxR family transcriptional regulator [Streptomyces sp. H27-C3]MDJ0463790.1 AAA family ATPase [Streptomyces sp. H27-C3]
MRLVERDRELSVLADMLRQSTNSGGHVTLIAGGIGCGKTSFLAEVAARATAQGFEVHGAAGSLAERQLPGAVLGQLLRNVDLPLHDREALADLSAQSIGQSTAGSVAELGPSALEPETSRSLQRLCDAVERSAQAAPLLLCVDDVQFMDALSVHWMLLMLRRLPTTRITLAMTECTLSRPADPRLHAELLRQPGYRPITLDRLSPAGVATILSQHGLAAVAQVLAPGCHAVSGGNPLLVRALAEDTRHLGADGAGPHPAVGDAYLDAATGCLHRGWPALLRIAQALAVLHDDSAPPELVAQLADVEGAVLARGMKALDTAGLLAEGRPRHPALRSAALGGLTGQEGSALHRRAAALLYDEGAPAVEVARHLLAAAEPSGFPWAVAQLQEAAERHLVASRPAEAQGCLEAALRVCAEEPQRLRIKALLAGTAWVLDPSVGARHLVELAVAVREGRLPAHYSLMLAKYLLWHGKYDEAADAIDRITRTGDEPDPIAAAEARATRELLSATYPALVPSNSARPASARQQAPLPSDPRSRGAAALSDVLRHGPGPEAVAAAQASMRAMRLGRNTHEWLTCAVSALLFADRIKEAADWCDHWLAQSRSRRVPLWIAEFSSLRAGIALRQGRPVLARELAEAALAQVQAESWGVCIGGPLANLIQANTDIGDHAAAAEYLEVALPAGMFHSRFGLYYLHARASHYLATGQPQAALDDFLNCGAVMGRWGLDQPTLIAWRSGAARAQLALGDTAGALALAREQIALAGEGLSRTRGISLRTLAAASRPAQRGSLLTAAVGILEECGDQLQLAHALADLSTTHIRAGRFDRAEALLGRAAGLAQECGTTGFGEELRAARPVPIGSARADRQTVERAFHLLSPAEQRVVDLAARGHTNREISDRLGITVSTVEQHLTRIFRKLGVRTRGDLPQRAVIEAAAG